MCVSCFASSSHPLTVCQWRSFFLSDKADVKSGWFLIPKGCELQHVLEIRKWVNCTHTQAIQFGDKCQVVSANCAIFFSCYTPSMPPTVWPPREKVVGLILFWLCTLSCCPQSTVMHVRQTGNSKLPLCLLFCLCLSLCGPAVNWRLVPCLDSLAAATGSELGDPEWEEPVLKMDGWIKSDFKQHNEKQKK